MQQRTVRASLMRVMVDVFLYALQWTEEEPFYPRNVLKAPTHNMLPFNYIVDKVEGLIRSTLSPATHLASVLT